MRLSDTHGRTFEYLRLSVTDACNFRCRYCLPNGYQRPEGERAPELDVPEIRRLAAGFAALGVWKVRLTGGEPTVRRDIVDVAAAVAAVPGIRRVALTTNGWNLRRLAAPLYRAGVRALNVSVDSLDRKRFADLVGGDRLPEVLAGIDEAIASAFAVKVNAVLLRDTGEDELDRFAEWVRDRDVSVRFIEVMRTAGNGEFFDGHHVSGGALQLRLRRRGWAEQPRKRGDGPAVELRHPDYRGRLGIIAPYSSGFCDSCNRLRVSSRGALRLCLFGTGEHALRPWLESDGQTGALGEAVRAALTRKLVAHRLQEGDYGDTRNLSGIGG